MIDPSGSAQNDSQEYSVIKTISEACIAEISKPVLTQEEYQSRRDRLEEACARVLRQAAL